MKMDEVAVETEKRMEEADDTAEMPYYVLLSVPIKRRISPKDDTAEMPYPLTGIAETEMPEDEPSVSVHYIPPQPWGRRPLREIPVPERTVPYIPTLYDINKKNDGRNNVDIANIIM